jgi:hypothetical protein
MGTINKDQSIITQVAAKIAADLTPKGDDVNRNIADWAVAFTAVTDALMDAHKTGDDMGVTMEAVQQVFPTATVVQTTNAGGMSIRIKGKQHGPLPEWLATECAKKGVTEVWDNRDRLAENAKRPWFKSTTGNDAFWPPRGR